MQADLHWRGGMTSIRSPPPAEKTNAQQRGNDIDQRDDYQAWVDNDRRAHELLAQLEALGVGALEADARSPGRR